MAKKKTKKQQPVTVTEIKSLLEGMDLFHGNDDWVPTEEQWQKIREKIESLEETTSTLNAPVIQSSPVIVPRPSPTATTTATTTLPAVPIGPAGGQIPSPKSSLATSTDANRRPSGPPVVPTGNFGLTTEPSHGPDGSVVIKTKTPTIDTSNGSYASPFE